MTNNKFKPSFYFGVVMVALIAVRLYLVYFPIVFFSHLIPPGVDPVNHASFVTGLLNGHIAPDYPPLFHLIIAAFSKMSSADPLQVMKWVTPLMIVLPSLGIYIFLRNNIGRMASYIGFAITLLASNYGFLAYVEGNYPNILAAGFFMPISLSYLLKAIEEHRRKNFVCALIFFVLVILTHHLTAALMVAIVIAYLVVLTIWNHFEPIVPKVGRILASASLMLLAAGAVAWLTPLKTVFIQGYNNYVATKSVVISPLFKVILKFPEYADAMGEFSFFLGMAALFYLIIMLSRPKDEVNKPMVILALVWFLVIFFLSRTNAVGIPARIGREVAIPLLIAVGIFISDLVKKQDKGMRRFVPLAFLGFLIYMNFAQVNAGVFQPPEFFNNYVLFWPEYQEKIDELDKITSSSEKVLANPLSPYLPYYSNSRIALEQNENLTKGNLLDTITDGDISYILIMKSRHSNPYEFWTERNDTVAGRLIEYSEELGFEIYHEFPDGSIIYKVESATE